jgi:hypothetical protein
MPRNAMLAIWSDIEQSDETDYLHWLTREHTSERVSTPGFVAVRVFRSNHADVRRYFICYDLEGADVVNSQAYVAKLNNPTPWSKRIMPLLKGFRRGGGPVRARAGVGQGGIVVPVVFPADIPTGGVVDRLAARDGISAAWLLEVDQDKTAVQTREKSMRANDQSFAALLIIEGVTEASVTAAANELRPLTPASFDGVAYRQVFSLHRDMLATAT